MSERAGDKPLPRHRFMLRPYDDKYCSVCGEPRSAHEPPAEPKPVERMPMLKHEADRVLVTEAGLCRWLAWAMDMMDSYETRLIQKGDPPHLVHSDTHMRRKREIRKALGPQCGPCRDGNKAIVGPNGYMWHQYSGGAEPCLAGAGDSDET